MWNKQFFLKNFILLIVGAFLFISTSPVFCCYQDASPIPRYEGLDIKFAKVVIPFDYLVRYYSHHIKLNIMTAITQDDWDKLAKAQALLFDKYEKNIPDFVTNEKIYYDLILNIKESMKNLKQTIFDINFNKTRFLDILESIKRYIINIYEKRRDESDRKYSNEIKYALSKKVYPKEVSNELVKSITKKIFFSKNMEGRFIDVIIKKQETILKKLEMLEKQRKKTDFMVILKDALAEIVALETEVITLKCRGGIFRYKITKESE